MARPFTPRDSFGLRSLQVIGTSLELETVVLTNESPLRQALASCLPFANGGVETLVEVDPQSAEIAGFIQLRRRRDEREADLLFIAPGLEQPAEAGRLWLRLIDAACRCMGERGCQRVCARIAQDDRQALQLLRQLGFVVHASDTVFRRPADAPPPPAVQLPAAMRDWLREDEAVAELAQQAMTWAERSREGGPVSDWEAYPMGGRSPGQVLGRVWLDEAGHVLGAWRIIAGRLGNWLCALAAPQADAAAVVAHALKEYAAVDWRAHRPLYAVARGPQADLNLALRESGFEPIASRFWLVRHTMVRVGLPVLRRSAWQATGFETAPGTPYRGAG